MNVAFGRVSIKECTGREFVHFHINNSSLNLGGRRLPRQESFQGEQQLWTIEVYPQTCKLLHNDLSFGMYDMLHPE